MHPCDETSLRGAVEAAEAGLIVPDSGWAAAKITAVARRNNLDIAGIEIVDVPHSEAAAAKAVELIHAGKGELLMKGSLHTDELMRAVTASKTGLRTARRISHVFVMDVPTYAETLFITDAAINIFPDLDAKRDIVQNAIDLFTQIGLGTPRVAILSAVETVTSKIPSTDRRRGALQDGRPRPDHRRHARRSARVRQRGRSGSRAGSRASNPKSPDARRFWSCRISRPATCWPRISSFLAKADAAGIVLGARVPIILTSRADSVRTRMASCAVAVLYADARRRMAACRRPERHGLDPRRQCRLVEREVSGLCDRARRSGLDAIIKGQMDGIGVAPRLQATDPAALSRSWIRCYDSAEGVGCCHRDSGRRRLASRKARLELAAVGHRVVHGGPIYERPVLIDDAVIAQLERFVSLAPLHQPNNLAPIRRHSRALPEPAAGRLLRYGVPSRSQRGWRITTPSRRASTAKACAATVSTVCLTNTSRAGCLRSLRMSRRAA